MLLTRLILIVAAWLAPQPQTHETDASPASALRECRLTLSRTLGTADVLALTQTFPARGPSMPVACGVPTGGPSEPSVSAHAATGVAMQPAGRLSRTGPANDGDGDDDDDNDNDSGGWSSARAEARAPSGPWIGVTLTPVPKMLQSHLNLEGKHLMVLNVVKDSPADAGGILQYDVLMEVNGERAPNAPEKFAEVIRGTKSGGDVRLVVVRGGKRTRVELRPGPRPKPETIRYKYEVEGNDEVNASELRGRVLQRTPTGQWQVTPFMNPQALEPLKLYFDASGRNDGNSTAVILETKDGVTTEIRKEPDGSFRVTRRDASGGSKEAKTRKYPNAKAFREADPEAYKLYARVGAGQSHWSFGAGVQLNDEKLRAALEQAERATKEAERAAMQAQERALRAFEERGGAMRRRFAGGDRPNVRFETDRDGGITVTTRGDDGEHVQHYASAKELKAKRPKLYERYQKMNADDDADGDEPRR
ncbi:MAG: PDZ domain-containing protein [Phycisphaerae bacterium]